MVPKSRIIFTPVPSALCTAFKNICTTRLELSATTNDEDADHLPACIPCVHWLNTHDATVEEAFPIYYFQTFITSLHTEDKTTFDRRTIWRLCKSLSTVQNDRINYFLTFFTSAQQQLIHRIAAEGTSTINYKIASLFQETHGNMLFAPSRSISEFLRDALVNSE